VYTTADLAPRTNREELSISVTAGVGIDALKQQITNFLGRVSSDESLFSARRRHLDAIELANEHIGLAFQQARQTNTDLFAEELRLAHEALGQIIGKTSSDDLLGRIFSTFCIGK
jgi:tRNA modification GTPase